MSATAPAAPPQSKFSKRKLLLGLAAATTLGLGGAIFYVVGGTRVQAAPSAPKPVKPIFVTLEPLTVNLHSGAHGRFLHVGVSLRMPDEKAQARVNEALPELRSRLLLLLSDRDPETLASPADKVRLAEQIRAELNRPINAGQPPHGITAVSFNAFVVQ